MRVDFSIAVSLALVLTVTVLAAMQGNFLRRSTIGFGVALYQFDATTAKDVLDVCSSPKATNKVEKNISTGPECNSTVVWYLFQTAAYTGAVASAIAEIKELFLTHTPLA